MKLVLTLVLSAFVSLGFAQVKSIVYSTEEDHSGHNHSGHMPTDEKDIAAMLKNFDYAAADIAFAKLNVPANEKAGWLKTQENIYISTNYPSYFESKKGKGKGDEVSIPAKASGCPNAGFEDLSFAPQWLGGTSTTSGTATISYNNFTIQSNGLNAANADPLARHTIMTTPAGLPSTTVGRDPIARNPATMEYEIPVIAPFGGNASVRLGNQNTGAQVDRLIYTLSVTPNNTAFYYQYAVVLNNPSNHTTFEQPQFKVQLKDTNGNAIGGICGTYNIYSNGAASDPSFTQASAPNTDTYYRKWDKVNIDLTAYIGQDVVLEFETRDCSLSGHYGYAYIDAGCLSDLNVSGNYCAGDPFASLVADEGFANYQWYGPNDSTTVIPGATNDTLVLATPSIGDTFFVNIGTSNGCDLFKEVIIAFTTIELDELYESGTCYKANFGAANVTATGSNNGYIYSWVGPDTTGSNTTGIITNLTAGNYNLIITSTNINCGADTTTFVIPTTPVVEPDSINAKFCKGEGLILAPQSGPYQWFDNAGATIAAPAGTASFLVDTTAYVGEHVYLLYKKPNGCYDSIVYTFVDNLAPSDFTITQAPNGSCKSRKVTFNDATPTTNLISYIMNGPNGYNVTNNTTTTTSYTYYNMTLGNYDVRVIDDGCFYDTNFLVNEVSDSLTITELFCPNMPKTLTATSVGIHSWTDPVGGSLGSNTTASVPNPVEGVYVDSCQNSPGCYFLTKVVMDSITLVASYTINDPNCYGGSDGSIKGTKVSGGLTGLPTTFSTSGPDGYTSNANPATGMVAGTYTVVASNGTCTSQSTLVVNQAPFPKDTLWLYMQSCDELGQGTIYGPEGYNDYQWSFGGLDIPGETKDSLIVDLPINPDLYYLTYISPVNGCLQKTSEFINEPLSFKWNPDEYNNVFTPNGDPVNGIYYPIHSTKSVLEVGYLAGDYSMKILNRWGNLIYETTDYLAGWDGTSNGNPVSNGVYYAEIMYRTKCDTQVNKVLQVIQVVR